MTDSNNGDIKSRNISPSAETSASDESPDQLTAWETKALDQDRMQYCKEVSSLNAREKDELRNHDIRELLKERINDLQKQIVGLEKDKQEERDHRKQMEYQMNSLNEKLIGYKSLKQSHSRLLWSQLLFGSFLSAGTALAFASENYNKVDALKDSVVFPQVTFYLCLASVIVGLLLQGIFSFFFRK